MLQKSRFLICKLVVWTPRYCTQIFINSVKTSCQAIFHARSFTRSKSLITCSRVRCTARKFCNCRKSSVSKCSWKTQVVLFHKCEQAHVIDKQKWRLARTAGSSNKMDRAQSYAMNCLTNSFFSLRHLSSRNKKKVRLYASGAACAERLNSQCLGDAVVALNAS